MSVSGLCDICQGAELAGSCIRCGSLVCEDHYDAGREFCSHCVAEVGGGETGTRPDPEGVDTYRF